MQPKCPVCAAEIDLEDVNIPENVAKCRACGELLKASDLIEEEARVDLTRTPSGIRIDEGIYGTRITATTRSAAAFFLVPFMLVWSGGSLGGIYGSQIYHHKFNLIMSLFGIPFIIGSVIFWSVAVMAIAGRVEISKNGDDGYIFTGVGPLGRRRRFLWRNINRVVNEGVGSSQYRGNGTRMLALEGENEYIPFGGGVSDERLFFIKKLIENKMLRR